jgi:arabinogalactan endo-1,4-beta-galactosidase
MLVRRRTFGIVTLVAAGALVAGDASRGAFKPVLPRWRGADISFTLQEEAIGTRLYSVAGGPAVPIEVLLASAGATACRLRVWVDPPAGYSDETSLVTLARRVHDAGLEVFVDIHYSDFWADPHAQTIPARWAGLSGSALVAAVRGYTRDLVSTLLAAGVRPAAVQIGNEVNNGILWPEGLLYPPRSAPRWSEFAYLLRAGLAGVADAGGDVRTVIHIPCPARASEAVWFYRQLENHDVEVDIIGLSYYPFWHGPLSVLSSVLAELAASLGRPIVVAESAYPWTLDWAGETAMIAGTVESLPEASRFPPTPAGQAAYFAALKQVVAEVPYGLGAGFFAWEPGYLPGVGAQPGMGNPYNNMTMFDRGGVALPVLESFAARLGS